MLSALPSVKADDKPAGNARFYRTPMLAIGFLFDELFR
jgi:hypothetical protein